MNEHEGEHYGPVEYPEADDYAGFARGETDVSGEAPAGELGELLRYHVTGAIERGEAEPICELAADDVAAPDSFGTSAEFLRAVDRDGWRLRLWDLNRSDSDGKAVLGYAFGRIGEAPVFEGTDFHCSPLHAVDADETVRAVMTFLTLRPGDTDAEYFDGYSAEQLEFADVHAEQLAGAYGLWDEEGLGA